MSIIKELNSAPYFDDYSPEQKDFLRILFRPGYAVQVRELNQLQSILQQQIERFGNHIFANGALIIGGQTTIDTKTARFLKIQDNKPNTTNPIILAEFLGKIVRGQTNGALALVTVVEEKEGSDPYTLIVKMLNGNQFTQNEILDIVEYNTSGNLITLQTGAGQIINFANFYGNSSTVSISNGIFFNRGMFVICPEQTATLEKYSDTPTKKVGLVSTIQFVTSDDDNTLLDNANGSYNYAAPGAHRLKVNLKLTAKDLNYTDDLDKFIELLEVKNGQIYRQVSKTKYSELGKTIARRTFDESGDYTVRPFLLSLHPHPTDSNKLQAALSPGKAYVKGFEFETIATEYLDIDRARDTETYLNFDIYGNYDNYMIVEITRGLPNINSFDLLYLYNNSNVGIGTARIRSIKLHNSTSTPPQYKVYLFDINITSGTYTAIKYFSSSATWSPTANILLTVPTAEVEKLYNVSLQKLIFPTGYAKIKTASQFQFEYKRLFTNVTVSGNSCTITTPKTNGTERFGPNGYLYNSNDSAKFERFVVVKADRTLVPLSDYTVQLDSPGGTSPQTATFTFSTSPGATVDIIATVINNNAVPNSKLRVRVETSTGFISQNATNTNVITLDPKETSVDDFYRGGKIELTTNGIREIVDIVDVVGAYNGTTKQLTLSSNVTVTTGTSYMICPKFADDTSNLAKGILFFSASTNYSQPLSLQVVDAIRLIKVINKTTGNITMDDWFDPSKDITYKFKLNPNQTLTHYDISKLEVKPEFAGTISGKTMVFFEYFNHVINDGFFCVSSYPNSDEIYTFQLEDGSVDLKNCIDFRPSKNTSSPNNFLPGKLIVPGTSLDFDVEYYLGRIDKIICTADGRFSILKGNSSLYPKPPKDADDGMTIYVLTLNPYTYSKDDVIVQYVENKRYTMRDIGKLERRIENIEYYTSLSLLESSTATFDVKDQNGNLRYKNGFLVDSFVGHNIGDVFNPDYRCSIDPKAGELRPSFKQKSFGLFYQSGSNVTVNNKLATLNYTTTPIISQPLASRFVNANPYAVFTWRGVMSITPSSDFWKDTSFRPANIINLTGQLDNVQFSNQPFESTFDEWNTNWNGQEEIIEERMINWDLWNRINWPNGLPAGVTPENVSIIRQGDINPFTGERFMDGRHEPIVLGPDGRAIGWFEGGISTMFNITPVLAWTQRTVRQTTPPTPPRVTQPQPVTRSVTFSAQGTSSDNFVVSVDYQPFIRSRIISFSASGMKPNTQVYPFFDNVDVSRHVTPTGGTQGGALITSNNGTISGTFTIPQNTFLVGDRIFRLTDSQTNDRSQETTFAEVRYTAFGLQETSTTLQVNVNVQTQNTPVVQQNQNIIFAQTNQSDFIDPLAQDFVIEKEKYPFGVFLESVNLYFRKKDNKIPIKLQIRNMINGYPGPVILGETIKEASAVNTSTNASAVTQFVFNDPIYLEPGGNYCMAILTDSKEYELWVAQIGDLELGTNRLISEQPYVGSLFLSQNAYTWTADQTKDLKFVLNVCEFSTGNYEIVMSDWDANHFDNKITLKTYQQTLSGNNKLYILDLLKHNIVIGSRVSGTNIPLNTVVTAVNHMENVVTLNNNVSENIPINTDITFLRKKESSPTKSFMDLICLSASVFNPLNGSTVNYSYVSTPKNGSLETTYTPIIAGKNTVFSSQREIAVANESFKLKISGTNTNKYVSPVFNLERMNFVAVENIINNDVTGETSTKGGNAVARYITRKITLDDPSTYLKVYLTAFRPSGTDVKVYYKINPISSNLNFEDQNWIEMNKEINTTSFSKQENEFIEFSYIPSSTSLTPFNEVSIKIVLLSNNTSVVPRVADFRAIILE